MNAGNTNFASHTAAIAKNEFCVTERGNSGDRRLQPNNSLHILSMPSLPRHWFDARTENTLNARALEHTRCCFISKVSCGFDFIIILINIWLFLLQFDSCFWAGSGFSIFRWFSVFEFYFCWYCSLPLIFIVLLFFFGWRLFTNFGFRWFLWSAIQFTQQRWGGFFHRTISWNICMVITLWFAVSHLVLRTIANKYNLNSEIKGHLGFETR